MNSNAQRHLDEGHRLMRRAATIDAIMAGMLCLCAGVVLGYVLAKVAG